MNRTDEILERLKDWQPVIDNPDELTEHIMANLPDRKIIPLKKTDYRHSFVIALRAVTAIAAIWLIGLFFYVNRPESVSPATTNEVPHYYFSDLCAGSTLKDVYTSRRRSEKLISYTQLRTMLYEKK